LLEQTGSYFGVDEAVRYAVSAGFEGIAATYWLSGELPKSDSKVVTIRCRKPA
jgi:hypothetical protein